VAILNRICHSTGNNKAHHLYSATNRKLQLQRRFASQTERACSL